MSEEKCPQCHRPRVGASLLQAPSPEWPELPWCDEEDGPQCIENQRDALREENAELTDEVEWWGNLVKRANLGTDETPSLKAYIEQLEAGKDGTE